MIQSMTKPTKSPVCPADSDQPGHLPCLIRAFAVCADDQADLSPRWAQKLFCHSSHAPVIFKC